MDADKNPTDEKTRRGPKPVPRRKLLVSMTESEYREIAAWAEADGTTKAALLHDMIARERERRASLEEDI